MQELQKLLQKHGVSEEEFRKDPEKFVFDHILTGDWKHYCHEWDGMAIDETCPEFEACLCFEGRDDS